VDKFIDMIVDSAIDMALSLLIAAGVIVFILALFWITVGLHG
jgi:hypothetical protein